jgi:hypothetical protein
MVIYIEHTIGLMFQQAMEKGEDAVMNVQRLVESGTIKETKTGYKYLVIEEKVNDKQEENVQRN